MFASAAEVASSGVEVAGAGVDGAVAFALVDAPLFWSGGAVAGAALSLGVGAAAEAGWPPVVEGDRDSRNTK
jgi:hypothetical protein